MASAFDGPLPVESARLSLALDVDEDVQRLGETHRMSRTEAQSKFRQFLREFHDEQKGTYPYRDQLTEHYVQKTHHFRLDMNDLRAFDPELAAELSKDPANLLPLLETAAKEVVLRLTVPQPILEDMPDIQAQLSNIGRFDNIRELSAENVSKLVAVRGIVVSAGKGRVKATKLTIMCRNCRVVKHIACGRGFGSTTLPRRCDTPYVPEAQAQKCPLDPFRILPDSSEYVDQQRLKLQENPEHIPTGEMPRQISLAAERYLVNTVKPGTRVTVIGIYTTYSPSTTGRGGESGAAMKELGLRVPYVRVVGIQLETEDSGSGKYESEDEEEMTKISQMPDLYSKICKSIAPAIMGHDNIKAAIACQLFGGSHKRLPDGMNLRGDINILLMGDPSVGKSQFLKFAHQVAPIGVYTSGKGSSAAGLTASVLRDPSSGDFHLEGGALVLADGGLVCIDEFDKMDPQDRVAIHEAMEQQTISIAKAGITTILNCRTSVLAAANPHWSSYNEKKSAAENIVFQGTILSRFDLIFLVRDLQNADIDRKLAQHIIEVHRHPERVSRPDGAAADGLFDTETLKKYIAYCRHQVKPRLSAAGAEALQNKYINFRKKMREHKAKEGGETPPIPITVRQLEAIVRLSESRAKMELETTANVAHVSEAERLFRVSTMHAATKVAGEPLAGTTQYFSRVKEAERWLRERVSFGQSVSTEGLIRQAIEKAYSEDVARVALDNLTKKRTFRKKRQGRMVEHVGQH